MPAALLLALGQTTAQDAIEVVDDTAPPIVIDAEHTDYDLRAGITRFRERVTIQRGAMLVNADEGRIFQQEGEITVIELAGNPATWEDRLDDGKMVHGQARDIHYDVIENLLTLTGEARLRHDNVDWSGDRLVYNLDTESLSGSGSSGERARVVIEGDAMRQRPRQTSNGNDSPTPPDDQGQSSDAPAQAAGQPAQAEEQPPVEPPAGF